MRRLSVGLLVILAAGCFNSDGKHEPPRQAVELNNQAYRAFQQGDMDQALLLVNDAIKLDAKFYEAYSNKAAILDKQGKVAEAVETLKELVRMRPYYAESNIPLGVLLEKMGRKEEANQFYSRALKMFSERAERASEAEKPGIEVNRAVAQYLLGDKRGAMATLDAVLAANPGMQTALAYKQRIGSGRREVFLNGPQ